MWMNLANTTQLSFPKDLQHFLPDQVTCSWRKTDHTYRSTNLHYSISARILHCNTDTTTRTGVLHSNHLSPHSSPKVIQTCLCLCIEQRWTGNWRWSSHILLVHIQNPKMRSWVMHIATVPKLGLTRSPTNPSKTVVLLRGNECHPWASLARSVWFFLQSN